MTDDAGQTLLDTTDPMRYQASRRVAYVSLGTNLALCVGQVFFGFAGHSQALVADGFHTISDLAADLLVLFALMHGAKGADEEHPYGHARIETAVTVALGAVLLLVAFGIAVRAGLHLAGGIPAQHPSTITLLVAALVIASKEGLYRYTEHTARRFSSDLLHASAWHHRSDAISSIIVFLGIAGSIGGIHYLDALAAIGVALFVARIGVGLGWSAIRELIDTGLDADQLRRIRAAILGVNGVKTLHLLRTRKLGGRALVDVHIIVDEIISVSEGHQISETVRTNLIEEIDVIADVMVHIDPEDDTTRPVCVALPLRDKVLARLDGYFKDIAAARQIERVTLHYLDGRICVELIFPLAAVMDYPGARELDRQLREAVRHDPDIATLVVHFSLVH